MLRRPLLYTVLLSILLVGLGFMLGQHHILHGGSFWPSFEMLSRGAGFFDAPKEEVMAEEKELGAADIELMNDTADPYPSIEVPLQVGKLSLERMLSGEEAIRLFQKIFGDKDMIQEVLIPCYTNSDEQVIVWVFSMFSPAEAEAHLEQINTRMQKSEKFNTCGSFFIDDIQIYHVQGLEMNNYYYAREEKVLWLSLVSGQPLPLFLQFYEKF